MVEVENYRALPLFLIEDSKPLPVNILSDAVSLGRIVDRPIAGWHPLNGPSQFMHPKL